MLLLGNEMRMILLTVRRQIKSLVFDLLLLVNKRKGIGRVLLVAGFEPAKLDAAEFKSEFR